MNKLSTPGLALTFTRLCLHWNNAVILGGTVVNDDTEEIFRYGDLNQVLRTAGEWAAGRFLATLFFSYCPPHYSARVASLWGSTDGGFLADNLEQAIFIACLEAVDVIKKPI